MADLKPCPFPHDDDHPPPEILRHATAGYRYIACECGATGPARSTVAEAIAAWNRRSLPAATDAEVEALARAIATQTGNDPDGMAADAVTIGMAWEPFARAALAAFVAGGQGG